MGVIKNLMVRIGADIRGYRSGMKDAANATSSTSQKINQHTSGMKKSVSNSFSSVGRSIKEYTATVAKTKEDYAVAIQNSERLSDKVQQMRGVYNSVKKATEGLDLSKPLNEMVADAEKALIQIESKRKKIEAELQSLASSPRGGNSKKATALQAELDSLARKSQFAVARLENLNRVADALGANNIGYASAEGLKQLEGQIRSAENELNTSKIVAANLEEKLKSLSIPSVLGRTIKAIGTNAAHAAKDGVSKLWQKLKGLPGSIVTSIASLPAKLRKIGSSASASCGGLGKMVKSIRNIGIASLGMRVASGMFGRLRSIISSYISQNEELNNTVTAMKNQLGEALLPAINLVLAAMQRLMPAITAVSSGINSVLTSLFGNMNRTAAAIKKTADEANSVELYGFDQITKASDSDSGSSASSGTGGSQSALVQKLTGWIERLKGAFVAGDWRQFGQIIGDGINGVFNSINSIDVGAKIGTFINNVSTALHGMLTTVDFNGIGTKLGQSFTSAIERVDWNQAGNVIGMAILALPAVLVGFVLGTDWNTVGQAISDCLMSVMDTFTAWITTTDWLKVGQSAADLIGSIDWDGIVSNMFTLLGAAICGAVTLCWGFIGDAVNSIRNYFAEKIEEAGGSVAGGLLKGILDGLGNIGMWIANNVVTPFVKGFSGLNNGVVDVVEGMINSVIGGINKLLGGLNSFLSLGKHVGLDLAIPTIAEVKLPRAARGTVVSKATDLTVGEDGTEAVMPLERHTEWMDVLASKLAVKVAGNGGGAKTMTFQFILGNRVVTEYLIKDINQITHENGVCPIKL